MSSIYLPGGKVITGTLVWYYSICKREVWLMAHGITPDEEWESLQVGRVVHSIYYKRMKKEIELEGIKVDFINGSVVCEVKTSSRYLKAARLQLLYYIYRLKETGIFVEGKLVIPKERKNVKVKLDEKGEWELVKVLEDIKSIVSKPMPPSPKKTPFCRRCAYKEFCWA